MWAVRAAACSMKIATGVQENGLLSTAPQGRSFRSFVGELFPMTVYRERQLVILLDRVKKGGIPMSVSSVASSSSTASTTTSTETDSNVLDQDAFLKLLITQLQNQDPFSPMDNTEMVSQLAQYSALEQMTQVREEIEVMRQDVTAINLLGKTVKVQVDDDTVLEGTVESVKNLGSSPTLSVSGEEVGLNDIIEVLE